MHDPNRRSRSGKRRGQAAHQAGKTSRSGARRLEKGRLTNSDIDIPAAVKVSRSVDRRIEEFPPESGILMGSHGLHGMIG
jgi:hypothetical protein